MTNRDRVGAAMDLLAEGLKPFVERELRSTPGQQSLTSRLPETQADDLSELLRVMVREWQLVFRGKLGRTDRAHVSELQDVRNNWAHNQPFSDGDSYRAIDTAARLLRSIGASQAEKVDSLAQADPRVVATPRRTTPRQVGCNSGCPMLGRANELPRVCPLCDFVFEHGWLGVDAHYRSVHERSTSILYREWRATFCEIHTQRPRHV